MSYGAFEDARTAYGTDEDVILIYNWPLFIYDYIIIIMHSKHSL